MSVPIQKSICYYLDFLNIRRCSKDYLPYRWRSDDDIHTCIDRYSRHGMNTLLQHLLFGLRFGLVLDGLLKDENLNLIYYVVNLVWARATEREKRRIVTILWPDGYSFNFSEISRIIRDRSWRVCQLQAPCMPPFSITTGADTNDCVDMWETGGLKYTISVNNHLHNSNCRYVLFLSNFEEIQAIDQIIGINELAQIIMKYVWGDFSVVNPF
jgi:hypothetical protein